MKKCRTCGVRSKNKSYKGDLNLYNDECCMPCAMILQMVDIFEHSLNQPNLLGQTRKVKLGIKIEK